MNRALAPLCAATVLVIAGAAAAAPPQDAVSRARALANEAGDLLDQKKWADALERVEQAEATFHAPTHLVMMGEALEGLGRFADAMAVYEKLAAEPIPQGAPQAFRRAQQEAATKLRDLVARVPSVRVRVSGAAASGAKATFDGQPVDLAAATALRADPGRHELRVESPGFTPRTRVVELPTRGGVVDVTVTLDPAPVAAPAPAAPAPAPEAPPPSFLRSRTPAWIALGVGGAGLFVGAVTGGLSLGKVSALKTRCPDGACAPSDQGDIDTAGALGTTSTVAFVVGGVAVAAGVVLLVVNRPPKPRETAGLHLTPTGLGATF